MATSFWPEVKHPSRTKEFEAPHGYMLGNVEKSRQRRSRPFAVLTYYEYAPRVKMAAALLDELF